MFAETCVYISIRPLRDWLNGENVQWDVFSDSNHIVISIKSNSLSLKAGVSQMITISRMRMDDIVFVFIR